MTIQKSKAKKKPVFKPLGKGNGLHKYPRSARDLHDVLAKYRVEDIDQVRWGILMHHVFELMRIVSREPANERIIAGYKADLAVLDAFENSISRQLRDNLQVQV